MERNYGIYRPDIAETLMEVDNIIEKTDLCKSIKLKYDLDDDEFWKVVYFQRSFNHIKEAYKEAGKPGRR